MAEEWVLEWFEKNAKIDKEVLRNDLDKRYLDEGYIDSFSFITLISEAEEQFHIQFSDEDFESEEMLSVSGLIRVIERKCGN